MRFASGQRSAKHGAASTRVATLRLQLTPRRIKTNNPMLPKRAIEEFKKIYKKSYGVELSGEEATDKANRLVNLYKAVYSDEVWKLQPNFRKQPKLI